LLVAEIGEGNSTVLPLESLEWALLRHAYGPASDIPGLLRRLAADPGPRENISAESWELVWSRLCHQDDVYTASYAAVPHIVEIARTTQGPIDFSFLLLPTCIEISRRKRLGPAVPASLAGARHLAISTLSDCVCCHAAEEWDDSMARAAAAALVVAKGHTSLGDALINLDRDTIAKIVNDEL
jgi:hypothetical protein